ncbi:MAG: TetR/AcrR family transcriptional regulator [Acidimicrobiia bacterium]
MEPMDEWGNRHWQLRAARRAFERMVEENKRADRRDPAAALVAAAQELAHEKQDFTVKEVADRAGVAVQTFYRHFGSKDELVLAVIEENLARGSESISETTSGIKDPLGRLEAMVHFMLAEPKDSPGLRFHARERVRLSESYAAEVEAALSPIRMLLIDAVSQAAAAGEASPVDIERDADIILHILLSYAHALASHAIPGEPSQVADYVWGFCLAALRRGSTEPAERLDQRAT